MSCVAHQERKRNNSMFDFHKRRQRIIRGTEEKKNETKRFWIIFFFWEGRKKNHPAALINAQRKQSSRFALMRWSFRACYSSWSASPSACFPWLHHHSIANTLHHSTHHTHCSVLYKREGKKRNGNILILGTLRSRMLSPNHRVNPLLIWE